VQTISNKQTCTLSQFYAWLIRRNVIEWLTVDCCYHFLLVEGVGRHLSLVAKTRLGVTGRLVSGYSLLPPHASPALSAGLQYHGPSNSMHARACTRWVTRREYPLIYCVVWPVNRCWTFSDAHNIGRYNSSRYDSIRYTQYRFRYDIDPIIVRSLSFHSQCYTTTCTVVEADSNCCTGMKNVV